MAAAPVDEVAQRLQTDPNLGLSPAEAQARLEQHGPNQLQTAGGRSLLSLWAEQIRQPLVLILLGACAISAALGEWMDVIVILLIVLLNAALGATQEGQAERALAALKKLSSPQAKVVRAGHVQTVPAASLVPGDLVWLEAGDHVPADCRLVEAANLRIDEAALTGESVPVEKRACPPGSLGAGLGDLHNLAFSGTVVRYGRGRALVFATGMETVIGRIAGVLQQTPSEPTPLQRRMAEVGKTLGLLAGVLVAVVFATGLWRGIPAGEMFMAAISLAVAAIPEGLPAVVTVVLALGVQQMAARKAIVRRLAAVETLGTATAIASDKTGTLTQNEMTVTRVFAGYQWHQVTGQGYRPEGQVHPGTEAAQAVLAAAALASDARLDRDENGAWRVTGDPTEGALVVAAAKAGWPVEKLAAAFPRVAEIPFDSERKRMTTFHRASGGAPPSPALWPVAPGGVIAFTKGAPDLLLPLCVQDASGAPMTEDRRARLLEANAAMAGEALRVLAVAYRLWEEPPGESTRPEEAEAGLTFLGFVGMLDPARPEVPAAVESARRAGIRPLMITGDYRDTAVAIGRQVGIWHEGATVLTGAEIDRLDQEQLTAAARTTAIYARVSPEHKLRIVRALQACGHVVAVTGDGVNDAPALKGADIGVAMGITGTDVAKEAADMVLADDNFATIVAAVQEGRAIYANIRKSIQYLLSCNIGEIAAVFSALAAGLQLPLTAIQILWVNLVTDGLPALALGMEKPEKGIMDQPPRKPKESVFAGGLGVAIAWQGLLIGAATLAAFAWALRAGKGATEAGTIAFATLAFSQLVHSLNARSLRLSVFQLGPASNRPLLLGLAASALLQLAVLLIPALQPWFGVVPLDVADWVAVALASLSPLLVGEGVKLSHRLLETRRRSRGGNGDPRA